MQVRGGFSGARLGGIQAYANDAYGYSLYLPKDFQVEAPDAGAIMVLAPGTSHPGEERAAAFIDVEPADGRTAGEIVNTFHFTQ